METSILPYFLKVNLALAILYICYRLLFRNDTFFRNGNSELLFNDPPLENGCSGR